MGSRLRLVSRQGVDHTDRFSEIAVAIAKLFGRTPVLDGEVCVFDRQLVSQFHLLGDVRHDELATPPVYIAFDVLHVRGRDVRTMPLVAGRRRGYERCGCGCRAR